MSLRISKEDLEKLFKIVRLDPKRKARYPDKPHMWYKYKAKASEAMGLSRTTIDKYLDQYPQLPEKPKKTIPKYYEEFEQTECAKRIKEIYWDRKENKLRRTGVIIYSILREAWRAKGKIDPLTFDLEDFLFFWGTSTQAPYPPFVDPLTNSIDFNKAIALRFAMRMGQARDLVNDPRFTTKGLKREAGRKAFWYLEPHEIIQVVNSIKEIDTLMLMYSGILMGGRISALLPLTPDKIHRQIGIVEIYEIKIRQWVRKRFYEPEMSFLWQYIIDFNIQGKLFHWGELEYNRRFVKASQEAGLPASKRMTSHMLKHTCVTLMRLHGVELGTVSKFVDTDPKTLLDYYVGGTDQAIDEEIGGIKATEKKKTWRELVVELTQYFKARYNYLKPYAQKVDGFRRG